jgi:hypothetical protein
MVESPPASVAELKSVATKFRLAIERCGPSRLSIPFEKFPEGSCGEAAQLLRTFLQKRGLGTFKYVSGFRDKEGRHITHAWLEAGVDSGARCNPVDSIGSSRESRVSHSEPSPSAQFPRDKDGSARRNIEPLQ